MAEAQDKNTTTKTGKVGRPTKYKAEYCQQAYELCLLGATDVQLADHFEVNEDTIQEWKKTHPEFSEALKSGKLQADSKVALALYRRAIGFSYDEVTFEKIGTDEIKNDANEAITVDLYKKKIVTKLVVPDVGAQMNWLKNRQKVLWRENDIDFDKLTDEQLNRLLDLMLSRQHKNV